MDEVLKKLNFGCGSIQPNGWDNVDTGNFEQEFIGSTELFEDNTYDIVVSHCALQIVDYNDYADTLREIHRILKPNGIFRVSLPDIERGFQALEEKDLEWFPNGEGNVFDRFSNWLTWYSTSNTLLVPKSLDNRLVEAGFSESHEVGFKYSVLDLSGESIELDDRNGECYFMEARK